MKTHKTRNAVLALSALAALTVYILACTSFSPDDTKVAYPAFDAASGAIGTAVYDRQTGKSEMLFVPIAYETGQSNAAVTPQFMRANWLADGHSILVAYAGGDNGDDNDALKFALVPSGARSPIKTFRVPNIKDAGSLLLMPLCLAGDQVFFRASDKEVARLELKTGALTRHEFADVPKEICIYPDPSGTGLFYTQEAELGKGATFGRLNPMDFSRTPLMSLTNDLPDTAIFAYDYQGKRVAFFAASQGTNGVFVFEQGKLVFSRTFGAAGEKWGFGSGGFSPKGDVLWATFQKKRVGTKEASFGLIEVPLSQGPIRETTLIPAGPAEDDAAVSYFQGAASHDGKTVAVASTYLACMHKEANPADCALFLVDLSSPDRKVTKVPIPLPAKRLGPQGK